MKKRDLKKGVYQEGVTQKKIKVVLEPNYDTDNFTTKVTIWFKIKKSVEFIDLNALRLNITDCRLRDAKNQCRIEMDPDGLDREQDKRIRVHLPDKMKGIIKLNFIATGEHKGLLGLYKSLYDTGNESKGYFLTTQFEEEEACTVFPLIDHPAAKTIFSFEIIVPRDMVVVYNTLPKSEIALPSNKKKIVFKDTPLMCSYLLYIGIGDFEMIIDEVDSRFRAFTVPGKIEHAKKAVEILRLSVHDLEKRTGAAYPLEKLDIIGIPQFMFGAMENWGVLAHRESLMLFTPGETSLVAEKRIWEVIAHEVAHQWFGNLVSPVDWKYLWLNETLATYFGNDISQRHNPQWAIWDSFLREGFRTATNRASYNYDFPVELPDGQKIDISVSTAPIIYQKGASIYRMLVGYLGEDLLLRGLSHFLEKFQYSNVNTEDFYSSMTEATGKPIKEIMESWLEQPGHPAIDAARKGQILMISQRRFTYLFNESEDIWGIPLTCEAYKKNGETKKITKLFNSDSERLTLPKNTIAYKLNVGHTGLYNVKYSKADLEILLKLVEQGKLSSEDIFSLENDAHDLMIAGEVSINDYLALVTRIAKSENSFLPLACISDNLVGLLRLKKGTKYEKKILTIGKNLAERVIRITGLEPKENEPEATTLLRSTIITSGTYFGCKTIKDFVGKKFDNMIQGVEEIHGNIRASVMAAASFVRNDSKTFEELKGVHDAQKEESRKIEALIAMGALHDEKLIKKVWKYGIHEVPEQNRFMVPFSLCKNPYAPQIFFDLFLEDAEEIDELGDIVAQRIIVAVFHSWQSADTKKIESYFAHRYANKECMDSNVKYFREILEVENRVRHELV